MKHDNASKAKAPVKTLATGAVAVMALMLGLAWQLWSLHARIMGPDGETWAAVRRETFWTGVCLIACVPAFAVILVGIMQVIRKHVDELGDVHRAFLASESSYRALFEDAPVALLEWDATATAAAVRALPAHLQNEDMYAWLLARPDEVARLMAPAVLLGMNKRALALYEVKRGDEYDFRHIGPQSPSEYHIICLALSAIAQGLQEAQGELELPAKTGGSKSLLVRFNVLPGYERSYGRVILSMVDLTEVKRAEQKLAGQKRESLMQRVESLSTTGRLAAGVAHEINNPLQVMKAQLRLLADEMPESLREGKRMAAVTREIDQIAFIVRRLLDLHKEPEECHDRCNVGQVINNLSDLVAGPLGRSQIRVETNIQPDGLTAPISSTRLTQVLLNLLLNAQDAMSRGGVIRIAGRRDAEGVRVQVSDQGDGIAPENIPRLFTPFFTTKGPRGTGLGLSVSHSIVRQTGGRIEVQSSPGQGATFEVIFPSTETPS